MRRLEGPGRDELVRLGGLAGRAAPASCAASTATTGTRPSTSPRTAARTPTGPGADGQVHDADRVDYLAGHLGQLARAIDDGCDVRGYFAWSLLDNFEWAAGYTQRFGIVWVDFDDDGRRIVKDSGWWLRDVAAAGAIDYDDALACSPGSGRPDPLDEPPDPPQRLLELLVRGRVAHAHVPGARRPEGARPGRPPRAPRSSRRSVNSSSVRPVEVIRGKA